MKILLVVIKYKITDNEDYNYFFPSGLAYILSVLKINGYNVDCLNLNHTKGPIETVIKNKVSADNYDMVLMGGLSVHYSSVKICVNAIRKFAPQAKIVLGGGLVSSQPELIFKTIKPDFLVTGEGEFSVLELLRCFQDGEELHKVDGIGYCDTKGELILNKPRAAIADIDSLPWPDYEGMEYETYLDHLLPSHSYVYDIFDFPRPYTIISSRSCPFSCTFCFHPLGKKYRQRSIDNIMGELSFAIKRYRANLIFIQDELFSYNKARVYEFCDKFKDICKEVPWDVRWACQMRVDKLDQELLETMKDAGCYQLSLGLESYSSSVLKSMKKHISPSQIDQALRIAKQIHLSVQGNFIFGDIAETKETASETLNYWKKNTDLFGAAVSIGFIQPYPGTALYKHILKKGIIDDEINWLENNRFLQPINMSDVMSDGDFELLKIDLKGAEIGYRKIRRVPITKNSNGQVRAKCPYCNSVNIYSNYAVRENETIDINCRVCRMRYWITTKPGFSYLLYNIQKILIRLIGAKKVLKLKDYIKIGLGREIA